MILITEKNTKESLKELFSFDADFNGDNGLEYTSQKALDSGFESDIDYFVEEAMNSRWGVRDRVNYILTEFMRKNGNYYTEKVEFLEVQEGTVVTLGMRYSH